VIRHVAGLAEIVDDVEAAVELYRSVLGLEVEGQAPGYAVVKVPGVLHFGLWSRPAAAEAVFGDAGRATEIPLGLTLAFEVDSVNEASETLTALTASAPVLIQTPKTEPWGQRTCRFRLPSGALGELSETPWARRLETDVSTPQSDDAGSDAGDAPAQSDGSG